MATLAYKEIQKMSEKDREKKLKDLRLELAKAHVGSSKSGSAKVRETKKIIARINTFNASHTEVLKQK